MNQVYLVCTRSAINASALTYMINQSPRFYHNVHNDVWLSETSNQFGIAYTINDWWNIPLDLKAYDKSVRNADVLQLEKVKALTDNTMDLNLGSDIALFTHATNPKQIEKWAKQHRLPLQVISTNMGHDCHHFVASWLRREYNEKMNEWQDQAQAWDQLSKQRLVQDARWQSKTTLNMIDWLGKPKKIYNRLRIPYPESIGIWLNDYNQRNSIDFRFNANTYWNNLGTMTKLTVFMWLLNKIIQEHPKKALAYSEKLYIIQQQHKSAPWQVIDSYVKEEIGLTNA